MTSANVEALLLEECKKHPLWIAPQDKTSMEAPKDYTEHTLDGNKTLETVDKALLGQAVQRLLAKSRLALHDHPKGRSPDEGLRRFSCALKTDAFGLQVDDACGMFQRKSPSSKWRGNFHF